MKILPVINFQSYNLQKPQKSFTKVEYDRFNFCGYVDSAMQSDDIQCPICGQKMLSEKGYKNLIEKASHIDNTSDFVDLLRQYRRYIPLNMMKIYESSQNISDDMSLFEYFKEQNIAAYEEYKQAVNNSVEVLKNYQQTLPDDKKPVISNLLESIGEFENYFNFKQKFMNVVPELELSKEELFVLQKKLFTDLKDKREYFSIFNINNKENLSTSELSREFVRNLFLNSVLKKVPMTRIKDPDGYNNEVLTCYGCHKRANTKSFLTATCYDNSNFKNNIIRYLENISAVIGGKNLEANPTYVSALCNFVMALSRGVVKFSEVEVQKLLHLNYSLSRHELFTPIDQTKVDIHCAGCSAVMMPFSIRKEFEEELKQTDSLIDYAKLIHKYQKYIGPYSKDIAKLFLELVIKDSNMSEDRFINALQKSFDKQSKLQTEAAFRSLKTSRYYVKKYGSREEVEKLDIIISRINDYFQSGKFDNFFAKDFFDEVFKGIDLDNNCPTSVYDFCGRIRKTAYINTLVKPDELDAMMDKNRIHTIVFNIFKTDFATADHLVAHCKDGKNTKDNLIGLCKACNQIVKNGRGVSQWINSDPRIKYFLRRQIDDVMQMSEEGVIEGYENWAYSINKIVLEATKGRVNLFDIVLKDS